MRTVSATLLVDLRSTFEGWGERVAFGVGYDNAIYAAARKSKDDPTECLVVRVLDGKIRTVIVPGVAMSIWNVQPMGDDLLLVDARCQWRPDEIDRNAFVVDWGGKALRSFTLGDGIEDVRTTADGNLWVSYFDEGIFGSYGWSRPGPPAMGGAGLLGFDWNGKVRFTYDAKAAHTAAMCDAYAMNVTDAGDVWVYFYSQFPIVRIAGGAYRRWKLGVSGARALAVRSGQVLLFGDYDTRNLGRLVTLKDDVAEVSEEILIDAMSGAVAVGRGAELFFFNDRQAFVLQHW